MLTPASAIAIIGFGDTGRSLGAGLAARGCALRAYDTLLDAASTRDLMRDHIEASGVDPAHSLADALRGAKLVIATTDASDAAELAAAAAAMRVDGQICIDLAQPADWHRLAAALAALGCTPQWIEALRPGAAPAASEDPPVLLRRGELP